LNIAFSSGLRVQEKVDAFRPAALRKLGKRKLFILFSRFALILGTAVFSWIS